MDLIEDRHLERSGAGATLRPSQVEVNYLPNLAHMAVDDIQGTSRLALRMLNQALLINRVSPVQGKGEQVLYGLIHTFAPGVTWGKRETR